MSDDHEDLTVSRALDRHERGIEDLDSRVGDLDSRVGEHDTLIRQLAGGVADLARKVGAPEGAGATGVPSWLLLTDAAAAREILDDLSQWVEAVYLRYPRTQLPACWLWHPAVVEELWWLRNSHAEALRGGWARVAEWHDRYRPGVVRRVGEAVGDCDLDRHTSRGDRAARPVAAPLARHTAEIADAWVSTGLPPEPTAAQIHDAEQYEAAHGADQ